MSKGENTTTRAHTPSEIALMSAIRLESFAFHLSSSRGVDTQAKGANKHTEHHIWGSHPVRVVCNAETVPFDYPCRHYEHLPTIL